MKKSAASLIAIVALLTVSCSKPSSGDGAEPSSSATPSIASAAVSAIAPADPAPQPVASVTAASSAAPTHVVAPSTATAAASHTALAASSTPAASVTASPSAAPGPVQFATIATSGNHYALAFSARTACAVGAECSGTLTLTANGGYHVNDEYPYRFTADAAPNLEWLAADGATFGKSTGDFKKTAPTVAELTLRYRGKQAGSARVGGTYKMSVCSEANCQLETVPIAVDVVFR